MKIVTILGQDHSLQKKVRQAGLFMEHNQSLIDDFLFLDKEEQKQLKTKN